MAKLREILENKTMSEFDKLYNVFSDEFTVTYPPNFYNLNRDNIKIILEEIKNLREDIKELKNYVRSS